MTRTSIIAVAAAVVAIAVGFATYQFGVQRGMRMAELASAPSPVKTPKADPSSWTIGQGQEATRRHEREGIKAGDVDPVTGRRILYYHDPMVPGKQFTSPGKSPFMDMLLVPTYAGSEGADPGHVTISPRVAQNLGVRTALVVEAAMAPQVSAVGSIAFNERDQAVVQARTQGYVEKLHVRATQDRVAKGQPLVDVHFPDWVAAQEEFLAVRNMQGRDLAPLVDGARQRMRQVGMSEEQIVAVEQSGRIQVRTTLYAPIGGVVTEIAVREGSAAMPGATLFRINGLSTVWANAELPESVASLVRTGMRVTARSPALPGTSLDGRVQSLVPEVNAQTRTLKARIELPNPAGKLVPGTFVQLEFAGAAQAPMVTVPSEAVIQTGKRAVVMLAEEGGRFRPVDVEIGNESGGRTEIRRGLSAGQRVVLSGQFLIDSEASLKGLQDRLLPEPPPNALPEAPHADHSAPPAASHDHSAHTAPSKGAAK
jgi:Cu(I)/Ag(I) efflux system membrane fusion protein